MSYEQTIIDMINTSYRATLARALYLGGVPSPSGGAGGPPGGFVGYLQQKRVGYDTAEIGTLATPVSGMSLYDNLNHIRYRIGALETASGGAGGHEIYYDGTLIPTEPALNFLGNITVVDNPGANRIDITVTSSGVVGSGVHNDLTGLQGGTTNEYYHLTEAQASGIANEDYLRLDLANVPLTGDFLTISGKVSVDDNRKRILILPAATVSDESQNLVIESGSPNESASDKMGGNLYLNSGKSRGNCGSQIHFATVKGGASGSGENVQQTRLIIDEDGNFNMSGSIHMDNVTDHDILVDTTGDTGVDGKALLFGAGWAASGATNKAGGNLTLKSGLSTGTATASIILQTPTPTMSGASYGSFATRVTVDSTGMAIVGNVSATNLSGTNTGDNAANSSSTYIGTTAVALNRASGALTLAGLTLTTPVLGVATATSINKVAITAPATSATLTIATGATLTASATANVSGTNSGDITLGTNTATALTLTGQVLGLADKFVQIAGDSMTGALVVSPAHSAGTTSSVTANATLSGNQTHYSMLSDVQINNTMATLNSFRSEVTIAANKTLTTLTQYSATAPNLGAGAAVTNRYSFNAAANAGPARIVDGLMTGGDPGGEAGYITFTNVVNTAAGAGVGAIKMNGATNRNSTGWLKIYDGTGARHIPFWTTIT